MSTKTRSALRATLKQEDAALEERLPEASPPPATAPETAATASADNALKAASAEAEAPPAVASASAAAPAAPAATAAPATPAARARPEKRTHERFKLAASDRRRLRALRDELKASGRPPSKSELVRAGIAALAVQGAGEVMALVGTLSPAARAKDKSASRKKDKKASRKQKGKSASKKR
ncbi:MAG TPA: hypothetical protein GX403_15985 [Rhodocyclaceae bacterium]|nr:hypothetical protein [Rhodocyclaceae bacterium]